MGKQFISGSEFSSRSELVAHLKSVRNLGSAKTFSQLHDPFLMLGVEQAVAVLERYKKSGNRVMVYGDFDTDGITSTVILMHGLQALGFSVSYRIPDREKHSHGLNSELIDEIVTTGTKLLITVDCGINDQKMVDYAKAVGLEVIITDHHQVEPELRPAALAIINPHQAGCQYPEKNLSGAGVAFKLLQGVASRTELGVDLEKFLRPYLELVAIGMVADCVPLTGEVRDLVKLGLARLQNSTWPGLALMLESVTEIDEQTIGFSIAPRLNAASRMGEVGQALAIFLSENHLPSYLEALDQLNAERKRRTEEVFQASLGKLPDRFSYLLLHEELWENGLVGLVASKLCEKFGVPCFVGGKNLEGDWHFSARGPAGWSVIEALRSAEDLFLRLGGHARAAGFTVRETSLEPLRRHLDTYLAENQVSQAIIKSEAVVSSRLLTLDLVNDLSALAPFGMGNPEPIFEVRGVKIVDLKILGSDKNHLKILGQAEGQMLEILAFFQAGLADEISLGDQVGVFVTLSVNRFRGEERLGCQLVAFWKD